MKPQLIIGNYSYSSWSLRPWIFASHLGIDLEVIRLPMRTPEWKTRIAGLSPTKTVPALHHDGLVVWDSLAVLEYLAEQFAAKHAWPQDKNARATARAASCEMHSGFTALRGTMPMYCRGARAMPAMTEALEADITRIDKLWSENLSLYGGPWLFGEFCIADAMFAPVASRFKTYNAPLSKAAQRYVDQWFEQSAMHKWYQLAEAEVERIDSYEQQ